MKYTIEKIREIMKENSDERETLERKVADLKQKEAELGEKLEGAAKAGNVSEYRRINKEKCDVSEELFVTRTYLDTLPEYRIEEKAVREAWGNYVPGHNSELKKKLANFAEAKRNLCEIYEELMELQEEAIDIREMLASGSGLTAEAFPMDFIPIRSGVNERGLLRLNGTNINDPDAAYYLSDYSIRTGDVLIPFNGESKQVRKMLGILYAHKPVYKL